MHRLPGQSMLLCCFAIKDFCPRLYSTTSSHEFTKTEVPIITICLPNYLSHSSIALVLLALVHCSKPARSCGKRRQPCSMPTGPQLSYSLVQKSTQNQTPLLWHRNNTQFTRGVPSGDMLRMSGHSQGIGVYNPKNSQHAAARYGSKLAKCLTHGTQAVYHAWLTPQQAATSPTASGCPPATAGMTPVDYSTPIYPHATIFFPHVLHT